jgi:hypothetical protein
MDWSSRVFIQTICDITNPSAYEYEGGIRLELTQGDSNTTSMNNPFEKQGILC